MPNAELARARIVNLAQRDAWFLDQTVALPDTSPPEKVRDLLERLRGLLEASERIEKKPGWFRAHVAGIAPAR